MRSNQRGLQCLVQHYNPSKYWKRRTLAISKKGNRIRKLFSLFYVKRCDAFNCASTGAHIGYGAQFKTPPHLPHGLNGIVISHNAIIGENVTIFHQVTIGEGNGGAPTIGDNCYIGAGAKIIGGIKIGNNVRIGAGCVVFRDIPDNATVVLDNIRIIVRE